jgi:hypothetical protein
MCFVALVLVVRPSQSMLNLHNAVPFVARTMREKNIKRERKRTKGEKERDIQF